MTVQRRKHAATRVAFRLESNADPTALLGLITLCARLATERTLRYAIAPRALVWSLRCVLLLGKKPRVSRLSMSGQCARYSTGTRL
jgi:hypothetical protein